MFVEHQIVKTKDFIEVDGSLLPKQSRGAVISIPCVGVYVVEFPTYGKTIEEEGKPVIVTLCEDVIEEC